MFKYTTTLQRGIYTTKLLYKYKMFPEIGYLYQGTEFFQSNPNQTPFVY